jgi:predicted acetyltransferase
MKIVNKIAAILVLMCVWTCSDSQTTNDSKYIQQNIYANIDVANSMLEVSDTVLIPANFLKTKDSLWFTLNKHLKINSVNDDFGFQEIETGDDYIKYLLTNSSGNDKNATLIFQYSGKIVDELESGAAEYARGFSETSGTITEIGVYLGGSTYWLPAFSFSDLYSFDLTISINKGWNVVSQGERTINKLAGEKQLVKYRSPEPMDEVYLIAAQWTEYSVQSGDVLVQAFLRTPDEKLANKYLGVTSNYIKLYENLIGPYPYTKFALVENFWETGYGMPSFTLLGEKVIRFPWILHSSYPHELLHNYWGNSVFVDYESGNWCEGITVYMADHLIKEQQGAGADYRRTSLQKFTDYVNEENDFPLTQFLSRSNSAEEAIGYGKSMMLHNMLRYEFGDEVFLKSFSKFYTENKFRRASFDDIRKSFEAVTGQNLQAFFDQWIKRKGAPSLELSGINVISENEKHILQFKLAQIQKEEVFNINDPVVVYLENKDSVKHEKVTMNSKEMELSFTYENRPLRVEIDPEFNIMRRLNRNEVPASLSQIYGEKQGVMILPKESKHISAYKALAEMWKQTQEAQEKTLEIIFDDEVKSVPSDKAVWIVGFDNKFADFINISEKYKTHFDIETANKMQKLKENGALVFAHSNPENSEHTVGFLGANNDAAINALARKLLHYGKYGYLGFESEKATNVLKGSLPALDSPLNITIEYNDETIEIKSKIIPRKALGK